MFGRDLVVPVMILKGNMQGKVLGITAAIHGNELNGIPVIQKLLANIDPVDLTGTIIAIPGMNSLGILNDDRSFLDEEDLNRVFPGKAEGNESQQMAYQLGFKLLPIFDYHIDLHTASFGRVNSMYVRADIEKDTLRQMAELLNPDIILHSKGSATAGSRTNGTIREMATEIGVKSITLEMGDPQIYNIGMIERALKGLRNLLTGMGFLEGTIFKSDEPLKCERSYWIYTNSGGLLEVIPDLVKPVKKGDIIALLKDPFGAIKETYFAPEDGIVIGKSTNPAVINGGRILHLGILHDIEGL
jgi:predicted deacylase